jgi:uncharacterized protein (TIGR00251 family)
VVWYRWDGADLILQVHLQPRASADALVGPMGERLKIRITAPPVDGMANDHLIAYLAKLFGVPKNQVVLEQGKTAKRKVVRIKAPRKIPAELGLKHP